MTEILALASYPTFDANLFTERIRTKKGRAEYARALYDVYFEKTPRADEVLEHIAKNPH